MTRTTKEILFMNSLRSCAKNKDIHEGIKVHADILKCGQLGRSPYVTSSLINMYAKCGMLKMARQLLKELPDQNVAAWNALIAGYVQEGQGNVAVDLFERMQDECLSPNIVTMTCVLKACGMIGAADKGKRIHNHIVNGDLLDKDPLIGNALVDMYAKCGMVRNAQQVLDELPIRTAVSWSSVIAGYIHVGECQGALNCFELMRKEAVWPDSVTLTCILQACGRMGTLGSGKQIHDEILARGLLGKDVQLANALVDMYAKCGMLDKARQVFEGLAVCDTVTWNSLIAGYVRNGQCHQALKSFEKMQEGGHSPNVVTFILVLKACGSIGYIEKGEQIHSEIVSMGLLNTESMLGSALVDMYAKCGMLTKALQVIEALPARNVVTWNALISGYVQQKQDHEALSSFQHMQNEGLTPNVVTYISVLKSCGSTGAIDTGNYIHNEIVRRGLSDQDVSLATALVDMYAKHGLISRARDVLDTIPIRNVTLWNTLIAGYNQKARDLEALEAFYRMQSDGISPDTATFTYILRACGELGAIEEGQQIHTEIVRMSFPEKDRVLGNALLDMYVKCGLQVKAEEIMKGLPVRDVVSWSTLIAGFVEQERSHEALECFERMQEDGVAPNSVTFICILKACGSVTAISRGKEIHDEIVSRGLLGESVGVGSALVDMYAKCGALAKAEEILEELPIRNTVAWSSLIAGYAQKGGARGALSCLERMQSDGCSPDEVTFLSILNACSHAGLLREAQILFAEMEGRHGIAPKVEHHTCIMVGIGSASWLSEALSVMDSMPTSGYLAGWQALLGVCRKRGNLELGRLAFDQILQLDQKVVALHAGFHCDG